MFIVDALLTIYDFFSSLVLSGQVPQENTEAGVYNFFTVLINLLSLLGIHL